MLERKLALSVSTDYNPFSRSYGTFTIGALPAPNVSADTLNQAIDEEITKALEKLNLDALEQVKTRMLSGLVFLKDNPFDAAMIVGYMSASGMNLDEIENYAENIRAVRYQDVKATANRLFKKSASFRGVLSPENKGAK